MLFPFCLSVKLTIYVGDDAHCSYFFSEQDVIVQQYVPEFQKWDPYAMLGVMLGVWKGAILISWVGFSISV